MKIVLTGGPSAGKTSITEILLRSHWDRLGVVREAAFLLFHGGFPRSDDPIQIRCQQRAIYHVQRELEEIGAIECQQRQLVCDRGSLDGLAYWPGTEDEFFQALTTTMDREVARYSWVIHLDTAPPKGYRLTNVRTESEAKAHILNERVHHAWRCHPNRIIVPSTTDFLEKVRSTIKIVTSILDRVPADEIRALAGPS